MSKRYYKLNEEFLEKEKIPHICQRCPNVTQIKCIYYRQNNRKEYICLNCKLSDPVLRFLPIKKKVFTDSQKEIIFMSLVVPKECERCGIEPPKIRKFDKVDNTVEFICTDCKNADGNINRLPLKKKFKY